MADLPTSWMQKPAQMVFAMMLFCITLVIVGVGSFVAVNAWVESKAKDAVTPLAKDLSDYKTLAAERLSDHKSSIMQLIALQQTTANANTAQVQEAVRLLTASFGSMKEDVTSIKVDVGIIKSKTK